MNPAQAMLEAARAGDVPAAAVLLAGDPLLAGARNEKGESAILLAAYRGHREVVRLLLDAGVELDLYEACAVGETARVEELAAAHPAAIDSYSPGGFTPLALASFFGHREIVEFLLARDAEVNAVSRNAMCVMPLHAAVAGRHIEIARVLLALGAEVNARQQAGFTPLHGAAQNGHAEMIALLLAHRADPAAKAGDGRTPLDVALGQGHTEVVHLLARSAASAP